MTTTAKIDPGKREARFMFGRGQRAPGHLLSLMGQVRPLSVPATIDTTRKDCVMLVLSRKENERLLIGEDVVVTVVRIGGDKVRLGVDAPQNIRVLRDELEPYQGTDDATEPAA